MGASAPIFSILDLEWKMTFEPKQKNKAPEVTVLCLFIAAGVAFGFSAVELIPGRGVLQLLALVLFCAMIFIAVRYKFTYYRYSVRKAASMRRSLHHDDEEEDEESCKEPALEQGDDIPVTALAPKMLELVVERKQGNGKWVSECILRLSDIDTCHTLPDCKEEFEKVMEGNKRTAKYKYFRNLVVPEKTVITADSPSGKVMVYLEYEKKLTEYLRAVAEYNKNGTV